MKQQLTAVFTKEFFAYFSNFTAYFIIIIYAGLTLITTFYFGRFFNMDNSGLTSFFSYQPEILSIIIPGICMHLWSDEYRLGTIEFLLTQPVEYKVLILGKYFASCTFVLLLALSTVFLPLITSFYGSLNISTVISGYIGLIFVIMSFCALSNLISMLSTRPVISFLAAFILIRLLMMLNLEGWQDYGFTQNYYNIISGRLALSSIMYFILMTLLSLWAEQAVISNKKTL